MYFPCRTPCTIMKVGRKQKMYACIRHNKKNEEKKEYDAWNAEKGNKEMQRTPVPLFRHRNASSHQDPHAAPQRATRHPSHHPTAEGHPRRSPHAPRPAASCRDHGGGLRHLSSHRPPRCCHCPRRDLCPHQGTLDEWRSSPQDQPDQTTTREQRTHRRACCATLRSHSRHHSTSSPESRPPNHHCPLGELLRLRLIRSTTHCGMSHRGVCLPPMGTQPASSPPCCPSHRS